jgi:hypothetical protein
LAAGNCALRHRAKRLRCSLEIHGPCIIALGRQVEFFATILVPSEICSEPRGLLSLSARTAIAISVAAMPIPGFQTATA